MKSLCKIYDSEQRWVYQPLLLSIFYFIIAIEVINLIFNFYFSNTITLYTISRINVCQKHCVLKCYSENKI